MRTGIEKKKLKVKKNPGIEMEIYREQLIEHTGCAKNNSTIVSLQNVAIDVT